MDMTEDDVGIYVRATTAKTSKNISQGSHKEGEKGNDEVKRILEFQFRVRQMERELKERCKAATSSCNSARENLDA